MNDHDHSISFLIGFLYCIILSYDIQRITSGAPIGCNTELMFTAINYSDFSNNSLYISQSKIVFVGRYLIFLIIKTWVKILSNNHYFPPCIAPYMSHIGANIPKASIPTITDTIARRIGSILAVSDFTP